MTLPLDVRRQEFWSKITSDIGGLLTAEPASSTQLASAVPSASSSSNAPPAPAQSTIMTTELLTTVWRTSVVTVERTTNVVETASDHASSSAYTPLSSATHTPVATTKQHSLPKPTTTTSKATSGTPTMTASFISHKSMATPNVEPTSTASNSDAHRKQAIIGGLAGAIAGLILIGILIVFFLRRRRKREDDSDSVSEKGGIRPAIARKWSELTARDPPPAAVLPVSQGTDTPDYDGGVIRMSLDRWPRPYANGQGYRESMGPRRLQVMNPSPSRPSTPLGRGSSESIPKFLVRQKTALANVFSAAPRSRGDSTGELPHQNLAVPTISVDPALSTECIPRNAPTPSFRSYPSVSSLPIVEQRPPEDPFLTPPDERLEDEQLSSTQPSPRRPGITPLQSAGRTLSHLGSALNPFRSRRDAAEGSFVESERQSVGTFSSRGDPFQYDRPSLRESVAPDRGETDGRFTVYEGT
ncbi:uncharacterized protein LTR77_005995 [Saxophila tyrrhenica]|uniref:Uncharacterized protein n=1 Tax=Saxophila tyrrhenica TaxID=1690608 RepID=A0AAV9P6W1_9PEZI|nr:hypothetical protein LTR77_005995 [Saxophila tyrrhenica]